MGVYRVKVWHVLLTLALTAAVVLAVFALAGKGGTYAVSDRTEIIIDNEKIGEILKKSFSSLESIRDIHAEITDGGKIRLSASVNPKEIISLVEESGAQIPRLVKLIANFMPKSTELELTIALAVDAERREFSASLEKIMLAGNEISPDMMPEGVDGAISRAVNDYLKEENADLGIVEFKNGSLIIKPKI